MGHMAPSPLNPACLKETKQNKTWGMRDGCKEGRRGRESRLSNTRYLRATATACTLALKHHGCWISEPTTFEKPVAPDKSERELESQSSIASDMTCLQYFTFDEWKLGCPNECVNYKNIISIVNIEYNNGLPDHNGPPGLKKKKMGWTLPFGYIVAKDIFWQMQCQALDMWLVFIWNNETKTIITFFQVRKVGLQEVKIAGTILHSHQCDSHLSLLWIVTLNRLQDFVCF